jgi:hypothetical protein
VLVIPAAAETLIGALRANGWTVYEAAQTL